MLCVPGVGYIKLMTHPKTFLRLLLVAPHFAETAKHADPRSTRRKILYNICIYACGEGCAGEVLLDCCCLGEPQYKVTMAVALPPAPRHSHKRALVCSPYTQINPPHTIRRMQSFTVALHRHHCRGVLYLAFGRRTFGSFHTPSTLLPVLMDGFKRVRIDVKIRNAELFNRRTCHCRTSLALFCQLVNNASTSHSRWTMGCGVLSFQMLSLRLVQLV